MGRVTCCPYLDAARPLLLFIAFSHQVASSQILTEIRNAAARSITSEFAPGSLVQAGLAPASGVMFTVDPDTAAVEIRPGGESGEPVFAPVLGAAGRSVLALLPKDLPLGAARVALIIAGQRQIPVTVTIVPSRFALFTAADGIGPAMAQSVDGEGQARTVTLTRPAMPGDSVLLQGTGIGTADVVTVFLGGHAVPATDAGPDPDSAGVDRIEFQMPDDPAGADGCYVALAVRAGEKTSPVAMLSTARGPGACRHPMGLTAEQMAGLDSGQTIFSGTAEFGSSVGSPDLANLLSGGVTRQEGVVVQFLRLDAASLALSAQPALADDVYFSCATSAGLFVLVQPLGGLDLGPSLVMAGGDKSLVIPRQGIEIFSYQAAVDAPPLAGSPDDLPPPWFTPGPWQLSGPGSAAANAFVADVLLPPQLHLTNPDGLQAIDRAQDLTVQWTPDGYNDAAVVSINLDGIESTPEGIQTRNVLCRAPAVAGSVTVPAALLADFDNRYPGRLRVTLSPRFGQDSFFSVGLQDGRRAAGRFTYTYQVTLRSDFR